MSNTRRLRQLNGGRLTRQRHVWTGHGRGPSRSPYGSDMTVSAGATLRSLWLASSGLPRKNRVTEQLGRERGGGARAS